MGRRRVCIWETHYHFCTTTSSSRACSAGSGKECDPKLPDQHLFQKGHDSALGLSWKPNLKKILSHAILKGWWLFYITKTFHRTHRLFVLHPDNRSQYLVKYHSNILTSLAMWTTHSSPQKALKWHDILMKVSEHLSSSSGGSVLQFLLPFNWNSSLRGIACCACWLPSIQGYESELC